MGNEEKTYRVNLNNIPEWLNNLIEDYQLKYKGLHNKHISKEKVILNTLGWAADLLDEKTGALQMASDELKQTTI